MLNDSKGLSSFQPTRHSHKMKSRFVQRFFYVSFILIGMLLLIEYAVSDKSESSIFEADNARFQSSSQSAGLTLSNIFGGLFQSFPSNQQNGSASIPDEYPTLEEFELQFAKLVRKYPELASIQQIGRSTAKKQPIWGIRISAQPKGNEDAPAVLFTGLHHAREPAGVFICKAIMQELLSNYGVSRRHTRLIDSLEIWLVPMVNPDGYRYILENQTQFPWWRKNLRDNDGDGVFNPLVDGVDLNRNYNYNWKLGGDGNPSSWFYRGRRPFSESEVRAVRDLAMKKNFVIGVSYHSYGEAILYPWGNFYRAPDQDLIIKIARECAAKIGRLSGHGSYNYLPLNGRVGQSSIWMYGELCAIDFTIETGDKYFPDLEDMPRITEQNVRGALFLLERALRSGISGHIRDYHTHQPLVADIYVAGLGRSYVKLRHSNGKLGRFDRLLLPGKYNLRFEKAGYDPVKLEQIEVGPNSITDLDIYLRRKHARTSVSSH